MYSTFLNEFYIGRQFMQNNIPTTVNNEKWRFHAQICACSLYFLHFIRLKQGLAFKL
jgi:hypothetical protein